MHTALISSLHTPAAASGHAPGPSHRLAHAANSSGAPSRSRYGLSAWLLAVAVTAFTMPCAQAVETSAAAASALKVLAMPLPDNSGESQPMPVDKLPGANPAPANSITVQKGESIDAVIRRGLPRLPLKDELLRQALAKANPKVFPKGQTYPVRPGTLLLLPSTEDLRQMLVAQYPDLVALLQKSAPESSAAEVPSGPDKRRWVRFP